MSDEIHMDIDAQMSEVFASWFETGNDDDLTDSQRDDVYAHLRYAFAVGRSAMTEVYLPLIRQNVQMVEAMLPHIEAFVEEG